MTQTIVAAILLTALVYPGYGVSAESPESPRAEERQSVIIVVGAPGTAEYGEEFESWARKWAEAASEGGAEVTRLGLGSGSDGDGEPSDRDRLRETLESRLAESTEPLWLVLIGHGTFDGREAKYNLRGPDVSAAELAKWLEPCKRPLAVINCASASGPFINRLSGPGRVIVTATKSGYEYNLARFGGHLATAISERKVDLDKDEQISLLEAFLVASARTAEFYEEEARLATEHALIDDNGDGLGTPAEWFRGVRVTRRTRDGRTPDGARANQFLLVRSASDLSMPADVRKRRDELELAVETLRAEKDDLDENAYYARLEPLLLELSRLWEGCAPREAREGGAPAPPRQ